MNLREFKKEIDLAEERLISRYCGPRYTGVCTVLSDDARFNSLARNDFSAHFAPSVAYGFWLYRRGDFESTVERRVVYLRMFEQWAITYRTYLNY